MIVEIVIFYLLLLDSLTANVVAFFGKRWYVHHFRLFSRWFPITKGWSIYYLVLVLWIGYLTGIFG